MTSERPAAAPSTDGGSPRRALGLRLDPAEHAAPFSRLVANGPAMTTVLDLVRRVAPSEATVLLEGESGTGKELVARMIHARSARAQEAFVAIDCGTLPETLLESAPLHGRPPPVRARVPPPRAHRG